MSPASGNWLKTAATEITGVKLPQLADNCNKQAVRRAKAALNRPAASHLCRAGVDLLKAQIGKCRVQQEDKHQGEAANVRAGDK